MKFIIKYAAFGGLLVLIFIVLIYVIESHVYCYRLGFKDGTDWIKSPKQLQRAICKEGFLIKIDGRIDEEDMIAWAWAYTNQCARYCFEEERK